MICINKNLVLNLLISFNHVTFLINNIINVLKDDKDFIECDSNYTGLSYYWKDDLKKVCETLENLCGDITVCNEREVEP